MPQRSASCPPEDCHDLRSRLDFSHASRTPACTSAGVTAAAGLALGASAYLCWRALRMPTRPEGAQPVESFDARRYLGRWYEIARIDAHGTKGLVRSRSEISLAAHGWLQIVNRGFDIRHNRWRQAFGKAQFVGPRNVGALKVSFFGPFYTGYNIVALDAQYQWAMVVGSSTDAFWILSRAPVLADDVRQQLLLQAEALGVNLDRILWVMQDGANPTGS